MNDLKSQVAAEVRAQLARRRMTARGVAAQLGWSQPYMARRIHGRVAFRIDELGEIAELLGVPLTDLLPKDVVTTREYARAHLQGERPNRTRPTGPTGSHPGHDRPDQPDAPLRRVRRLPGVKR